MQFKPLTEIIPSEKRKSLNEKCFAIASGIASVGNITKEQIYQVFTGKGALHGLSRDDYENYAHFSNDKKEKEMGQFYTPDAICEYLVGLFSIGVDDLVCDPTCGKGSFLNYVPNIENAYGNELENESFTVAKYLFDTANISNVDICYYEPRVKFDFIFGNPPFNLTLDYKGNRENSQFVFLQKCNDLLAPGGFLAAVVPNSFLLDEHMHKGMITFLNENFSFVGQQKLENDVFKGVGVQNFSTKIIVLQKGFEGVESTPYSNAYTDDLKEAVVRTQQEGKKHSVKINRAKQLAVSGYGAMVNKYLYEIKSHPVLKPSYKKAIGKVRELDSQEKPEGMSDKEWIKRRLTENKVLAYLKRIVKSQERLLRPKPQRDIIKLVKWNYGLKLKAYSGKAKKRLDGMDITKMVDWSDIVMNSALVEGMKRYAERKGENVVKVANRKLEEAENINRSFDEVIVPQSDVDHLDAYVAQDKKGFDIKLKPIQKEDLGLSFQKRYTLLNWQQGSGKSVAGICWKRYVETKGSVKYSFIVGPSIATKMTWNKLLTMNDENFVFVEKSDDFMNAPEGSAILISLSMVKKYQRQLQKFMKMNSHKVSLLFDESDEISNVHSQQRMAMKRVFRKAKYKLLTTGTATRNNITELYPQLELMYNNSQNLLSTSSHVYHEEKIKDVVYSKNGSSKLQATGEIKIISDQNKLYGRPFPAYAGHTHFRACFNPSKSSVFGIQKQNQDLYNIDELKHIAGMAILTRSFKDIVGPDMYEATSHKVQMDLAELNLYEVFMKEFHSVVGEYFASTGDSRKDAGLRIVRQMRLLIKACSTPQSFSQWGGGEMNSKMEQIIKDVKAINEPIIIGVTSKDAISRYTKEIKKVLPFRQVFEITGEISFKQRQNIINAFESFPDAIIVCTQQSLSSSVDIPTCDNVFCESMQWNFPKMEQFYFRAIRLTSKNKTNVRFYAYENSIEQNIMGLLLTKEKINEFVKTREESNMDSLLAEYGVDDSLFEQLITKHYDDEGGLSLEWGNQQMTA